MILQGMGGGRLSQFDFKVDANDKKFEISLTLCESLKRTETSLLFVFISVYFCSYPRVKREYLFF